MSVPNRVLNELFMAKVSSSEGRQKTSEKTEDFIRDRLRELAFSRKINPPKPITRAECQISVNHDTLVKIVFLEPQSRAMTMSFRGQPSTRIIRAPRAECAFYTISSEQMQKTEQELLVYDFSITKVIEDNIIKDIQEIEDREFLIHVEAACQALQAEMNGGSVSLHPSTLGSVQQFSVMKGELARNDTGSGSALVHPPQKGDIVDLKNMLYKYRLNPHMLLLTEVDFNNILKWTIVEAGSSLMTETAIEGYKHNTVVGLNYTRTIKHDILRPGNIYIFTEQDFFGVSYILNNVKFYIDKVANMITFQAWEDIGSLIANISAVRKLELYSGNANPNTADTTFLHNFIPVEEDELGRMNNRVDQGLRFPQIQTF